MHTELATLFIIGNGLDHGAENIGIDRFPVEITRMEQIAARDTGEAWHFGSTREKTAVNIRKVIFPRPQILPSRVFRRKVHHPEKTANDLVSIFPI